MDAAISDVVEEQVFALTVLPALLLARHGDGGRG